MLDEGSQRRRHGCRVAVEQIFFTRTDLAKIPNFRLESFSTKRELYATLLLSNFQVHRHTTVIR